MNPYTIICWKEGRELFSLSVEHYSPGEAIEFSVLPPAEHGKLKPETRIYNRGEYSYTCEDR